MSWKVIWQSLKSSDMRKRLLAMFGMLIVFRILAHIPIPLSDSQTLKQVLENLFTTSQSSQFLNILNTLSGGALAHFSIMLVGLGPYINASIIIQLLTKAIPKLETLSKEGEYGRKKINQYTRILTFPLAIIQSVGAIYLVRQSVQQFGGIGDITANASLGQWALMVTALTGGAMMLMWLGELITEQSVGNGISLLITVGIVSQLPTTISTIGAALFEGTNKLVLFGQTLPFSRTGSLFGLLILATVVLVTVLVVKLNEASRNLTINYAKRVQGNRAYGGVTTNLPIKLITAGVIPIIFATAFLSVPAFVGQILQSNSSQRLQDIGVNLVTWFQAPTAQSLASPIATTYIYPAVYFLLVFVFTYFYTSITFNAQEIAENLQKQGGFIDDIRSGNQTEKYLSKVVNRLTFFGALSLSLLAISPIILQWVAANFFQQNIDRLALGGTSVLILVAVALETLRAIESRALMVTYDQYEQPDYFYDSSEPAQAATGGRRLRFIPRRNKNNV